MGSFSKDEDRFFDACNNINSVSESGSDEQGNLDSDLRVANCVPDSSGYELWIKIPCKHL